MKAVVAIAVAAFFLVGACGKKKEKNGASGQARAAFSNDTEVGLASDPTYFDASKFGVKITSISLSTDEDTTKGSGSAIWVNPDCPRQDLEDSVNDGDTKIIYKYVGVDDCPIEDVGTYLDLAGSSKDVNTELNSQHLPILPDKTYLYAHINICAGDETTDPGSNLKFQTDLMDDPEEVRTGTCGFTTAKFSEPLKVTGDTKVKVTLGYDLSEAIYDYGEGMSKEAYCYFNEDETIRRCAQIPDLTAAITAED